MENQIYQFTELIALLYNNNVLKDMILIGSWAEYLYKKCNVIPTYNPNLKTLDIDFLVKNMRKPSPPVNLTRILQNTNYNIEKDKLSDTTKFISTQSDFEIEFLIGQKGSGTQQSIKTNLGVTADALRHMEILKENTIFVYYDQYPIEIPIPEAFVLHKMIINHDRKEKIEKDREVINELYFHIDKKTFNKLINTLTKKEKKYVNEYMVNILNPIIDRKKKIQKAKILIQNHTLKER